MRVSWRRAKAMTSLWKHVGIALAVTAAASVAALATSHAPPPMPRAAARAAAKAAPPAPASISDRVAELGQGFHGQVGIAGKALDDGWSTGWKDTEVYPRQR